MTRAAVVFAALLTTPALSSAQPMPGAADHAQDRFELRHDRRELADDRRDLFWTKELLARFDDAVARRARRALAAVENDVLRTLDRELREARREVGRSAGEAYRGQHDVNADAAADRGEWRDDRRDLRDDRRDFRRLKAIRYEFWSLRGRLDRRSLERKRGLLTELVHSARAELHEDRAERHEDLRELREDRREGWGHPQP